MSIIDVVVARHPDAENEIRVYVDGNLVEGLQEHQARVHDIDMGSSFDGQAEDWETFDEWAEGRTDDVQFEDVKACIEAYVASAAPDFPREVAQ